MGYGLWAMGYGLWAMGYGLWAMGYDEFIVAAADAIGASGAFVRRFFSNISVINFSRPKYALFEN